MDGRGWPSGLRGSDIPVAARIAQLAEFVEVAYRVGGIDSAIAVAVRRSATQFDPALVELVRLEAAVGAIASFVDLKSPYTLGHSRAVADLAAAAGVQLGLPEREVRTLRRAGLVHDFGRLGVSNAIWDKRRPLGAGEWERCSHSARSPRNTESAWTAPDIRAGSPATRSHLRRGSSVPPTPTRRCGSRARIDQSAPARKRRRSCAPT